MNRKTPAKFLLSLCKIICFTIFTFHLYGQDDFPTGDSDFTPDDVQALKENLYETLDIDGAAPVGESFDISTIGDWKLKIKYQGRRMICQSYAVAYAIDILDRNNYHSPQYIWDSLFYQYLQNPNNKNLADYQSCIRPPTACGTCQTGLNIWEAMKQATLGVPYENLYKITNCGLKKPVFNGNKFAKKYRAEPLYYNASVCKFCRTIEPPPKTIDQAIEEAKKKISNFNPVLISIYGPAIKKYSSGVLHTTEGIGEKEDWHAMTVVGYDNNKVYGNNNEKGAFKIANTWINEITGEKWGEDGYLWISYESFKRLVRFMGFMRVDSSQEIYDWEPALTPDGSQGNKIKPNSRIGVFQLELLQEANNSIVCLDANGWYPDNSNFQVILYECQDGEKRNQLNNQKWDVVFKEERDGEKYYILKSLSDRFKDKVLAVQEGKLVLEDESSDFNVNQLWLIRYSPETEHRAIAWAGREDEFILQGDENTLKNYSNDNAPEASINLETFNNLPRQTWRFWCVEPNNPKCTNPERKKFEFK